MADIIISRKSRIADIEKHLLDPNFYLRDLLIPEDFTEGGSLGVSIAVMQLILTWARKNNTKNIRTTFSAANKSKYTRFIERSHGLAAAYYSNKVLAHDSDTDNP